MLTPRGKSSLPQKIIFREGSNSRRCIKQDSEPNTLPSVRSRSRVLACTATADAERGRRSSRARLAWWGRRLSKQQMDRRLLAGYRLMGLFTSLRCRGDQSVCMANQHSGSSVRLAVRGDKLLMSSGSQHFCVFGWWDWLSRQFAWF